MAAAESCSNEGYVLVNELAAAESCSNEGYALVDELAAAELGTTSVPIIPITVVWAAEEQAASFSSMALAAFVK